LVARALPASPFLGENPGSLTLQNYIYMYINSVPNPRNENLELSGRQGRQRKKEKGIEEHVC
jgi:hypothetical protein